MKIAVLKLDTIQNCTHRDFLAPKESVTDTAERVLAEFMKFRRMPESRDACADELCQKCLSHHLPKVISAVGKNKPVTFVLPAFPGKSPNPEKVLGHLPDFAEKLSLNFLGNLCRRVKEYYKPGVEIIICSDGRVFSDVVGMRESNLTEYQNELVKLINGMFLSDITTFNLDDVYKELSFSQMHDELMKRYGKSLDDLKDKVRSGANFSSSPDERVTNSMYRGITRFLFEDSIYQGQTKSRTAIQKESRSRAYEVMGRSIAWSELIAERFPEAVRLSIHPQACGSRKLGIRLIGNETWMTPWHGVAVETQSGYVLLKRSEADALGAELICSSNGLPSHYKLLVYQDLPEKSGIV